MRRFTFLTISLLALPLVACGESSDDVKLQVGNVELTSERDGDSTVLSADGPVSPRVVVPDDALPSGVSSDDLTATVSYVTDPVSGDTAVTFQLGPDGTEFVEPVELKWRGLTDDVSTTAIMAVSESGENLLTKENAAAMVETMSTTASGDDGMGDVTLAVDHFSYWIIFQASNRIEALGLDGAQILDTSVKLQLDYWSPSEVTPKGYYELEASLWPSSSNTSYEACINPTIRGTGKSTIDAASGEKCGGRYDWRSIEVLCPNVTDTGEIIVDFTAFIGIGGLAPMERLAVFLGGKQNEVAILTGNDRAFAVANKLNLFLSGRLSVSYNCAAGAIPTSTPSSVEETSSVPETTELPPTSIATAVPTTGRGTTSGTTTPATTSAPPTSSPYANTPTTSPYANTPTSSPYGNTTTSITSPPGPPSGTWLRNDSRCSWQGSSSCGVYSSGSSYWDEVGPAGGPGSTFAPIAGTAGQLAYNLYSGNSITNCDWNGSGGCGYYFTGTPGTLNIGALG